MINDQCTNRYPNKLLYKEEIEGPSCFSLSKWCKEIKVLSLFFHSFGAVSGLLQVILTYYGKFRVVQSTTLQNVVICKFIKNKFHVRFYYKLGQTLQINGGALLYYKVVQFLCIIKWCKWYYKVGHVLQSGASITL